MKNTARIPMIDVAKGIGIILVVVGHTNLPVVVMNAIYAFHVPLFFVLSGMVFNSNKNLTQLLVSKFRTLLVPYYFFGIFMTFALYLQKDSFGYSEIVDFIVFGTGYNSALWFIAHLFILIIYSYVLVRVGSRRTLYIILLIHLFIGLKFIDTPIQLIKLPSCWRLDLLPLSFSFFMAGYLFREFLLDFIVTIAQKAIILIALIFIASIFLNMHYHAYSFDSYSRFIDMPVVYMMATMSGIVLTLYISNKLADNKFFQFIGKHTIVILSTHQFIPMLLTEFYIFLDIGMPSILHRILSIGLIYIMIVLVDKYARFLISDGKK
jgi:fucose 4-O-acetylase-like acetyltransferase